VPGSESFLKVPAHSPPYFGLHHGAPTFPSGGRSISLFGRIPGGAGKRLRVFRFFAGLFFPGAQVMPRSIAHRDENLPLIKGIHVVSVVAVGPSPRPGLSHKQLRRIERGELSLDFKHSKEACASTRNDTKRISASSGDSASIAANQRKSVPRNVSNQLIHAAVERITPTTYRLLRRLQPGCRLVLLGDPGQLPPGMADLR
jgi:hypothetical protein